MANFTVALHIEDIDDRFAFFKRQSVLESIA
jgi:hypothetical protein